MTDTPDISKEAVARHMNMDHNHEAGLIPISTRSMLIAMSARIAELEAEAATVREKALREAAAWHREVAHHDAQGMEYSSLVGIPISNWADLDTSVKTHEWCEREILALISKEPPHDT